MSNNTETDKEALKVLRQLKVDLSERLSQLSKDMSKSHSRDSGEQAVERENDEVVKGLESETRQELEQVKVAIHRLNSGKYHECIECESEISAARLTAIPYSTLCISCAEKMT